MRSKSKIGLVFVLVLVMCMSLLTACTETSSSSSESTSSDNTDSGSTATEEIIGEVTYVGSSYFSVSAYLVEDEITDYTSVDVSALESAGTTKYVYFDDETSYYAVSDGSYVSAALEDISVGAIIADTYNESSQQEIVILSVSEDTNTDTSDTTDDSDDLADDTTDESTDATDSSDDDTAGTDESDSTDDTTQE